jgi:transcriptional regulator with XRE-family HTH domain
VRRKLRERTDGGLMTNALSAVWLPVKLRGDSGMNSDEKVAIKKEIGNKLKKLRTDRGWTQENIAEKLCITPASYGYIERGETDLSVCRLIEIVAVFQLTIEEFFGIIEKNVFNFTQAHNSECHNYQVSFSASEKKDLEHELEKSQLLLQEREKEVEHLKKIIRLYEEKTA